jgi:hypothetical protein
MSWTYVPANLATSELFQVRFRLGDTVETDHQLEDEEITYLLGIRNDDVISTCVECCRIIIAKLAKQVSYTLGPYSESTKEKLSNWQTLLILFTSQAQCTGIPIANVPTTESIFSYDAMSLDCCEVTSDE